jgi:hypothetical protein
MARRVINEGSACTATARFLGSSAATVTPATVHYRLKDVTNNRIVTDWTEVDTAASVDIEITADENLIYADSPYQMFEERAVIVAANKDTPTQYVYEHRYLIKNLKGFDS